MALTYGVIALARPTFDVEFAEQMKDQAFAALDTAGIHTIGPRELAFDTAAVEKALTKINSAGQFDLLLIMQVTFTDASMTVQLAKESPSPLAIWAFPEPRSGGRLRLNALCGLNLAAHALGKEGVAHSWLFSAPDAPQLGDSLIALAEPATLQESLAEPVQDSSNADADRVMQSLRGARISVVGEHPEGFDTCEYETASLKQLIGVDVAPVAMETLFDKARATDSDRVAAVHADVAGQLSGLSDVNQEQLDRSFRLYCALQDLQQEHNANSMAVRCWPETFTEYGCAACGPMAMMNQARVPCACEADVYGSLSALIMQELAGEPSWMADLVDLDMTDDTAVLWHCGLAPLSMCDPEAKAEATIHTNRKMPLLHQFPLKPGRVTIARLSQARNENKLTIAGAEIIRMPMAFTGTSAVLRFDRSAREICKIIVEQGLEHHYALAYGDHRDALQAIAAKMKLPVLQLA